MQSEANILTKLVENHAERVISTSVVPKCSGSEKSGHLKRDLTDCLRHR